jgi:TonB family protein
LFTDISIPLQDFAPSRLVCLATSFKERYQGRSSITVNVFSSHKAASRSILLQEYTKEDLEMFAQMHARYVFDADRHEEYIEILPEGVTPSLEAGPYSTRIDLPVAAAPHCRLEIDSRCLIALQYVAYPHEALRRRTSGTVTLTGTISRGGKVNHVRVVKEQSVPEGDEHLLANSAVQDLSHWRVEPGPRKYAIEIAFSYVIDSSLPRKGQTEVQWALPNEVAIRGNPRE